MSIQLADNTHRTVAPNGKAPASVTAGIAGSQGWPSNCCTTDFDCDRTASYLAGDRGSPGIAVESAVLKGGNWSRSVS